LLSADRILMIYEPVSADLTPVTYEPVALQSSSPINYCEHPAGHADKRVPGSTSRIVPNGVTPGKL